MCGASGPAGPCADLIRIAHEARPARPRRPADRLRRGPRRRPDPAEPGRARRAEAFTGHKAKPHRVHAPRIPRHPFMAANGRNAVHNDAYQSDTYRNSGPLGDDLRLFSQSIDGLGGLGSCGITIAFDKRGRLITTCISATTRRAAPDGPDLNTVASHMLPPRDHPARREPAPVTRRRLLLRRQQGPRRRLDRPPDLRRRDQGRHARARQDLRPELGDPGRRPAQLGAAGLERPALVRHPPARHRRRARPGQRQRARHPAHERGDRQLVRHGRDRRRLHRHRHGPVPLRHRPRRQAQAHLARPLRQHPQAEAGPVRRRLRHHAHADGQAATCRSPTTPRA